METLIIQVNIKSNGQAKAPQLGITVEAPLSQQRALQQLKKQQAAAAAAKETRHHDYINLNALDGRLNKHNKIPTNEGRHNIHSSSNHDSHSKTTSNHTKTQVATNPALREQIQEGLQITQIQEGSVIDRTGQFRVGDIIIEVNGVNLQRPFPEAQRTLKQFVADHTSHGPLILKVLRKSESSSSLPSTTGSQITIIERGNNLAMEPITPLSASTSPKKFPATSTSPTSPRPSIKTSTSSRHLVGALNTRKIGTKHRISLRKGKDGFGIRIAERDNMYGVKKPIFITAITTTGSAYQDGRLSEGDMLLEVNGKDLSGMSRSEVTQMLKSVGFNELVELVISRQEDVQEIVDQDDQPDIDSTVKQISPDDCDNNNKSLIDLDIPEQDDSVFTDNNHQIEKKIDDILNVSTKEDKYYIFDIPLNDTKSAGLGLSLKYPTRIHDNKDLGTWVRQVLTEGAAWKDNRLQPNDQILAINGIDLGEMTNTEAHETLQKAVSRGGGPEPNMIRLHILRRDPTRVAKILQGTDVSIEHSDVLSNGQERSYSSERNGQSRESFQTALDNTIQTRSAHSLTDTSASSGSSQQNSQNDSAFSPQTQASNSIRMLSNSCNDKSDHYSSDKTNDTSSAISQITDFTSVPNNDNTTISDQNNTNNSDNHHTSHATTLPKSLQTDKEFQDDRASAQSWDDDSIDAKTGEERFQRDGFGRQSISEKRHAQLMAKNTDTYRRNKQQRDERERQRQLEEQLARQQLNDNQTSSTNLNQRVSGLKLPTSYTTSEFKSIYGLNSNSNHHLANNYHHIDQDTMQGFHREVPVDVHLPVELEVDRVMHSSKDNYGHLHNNNNERQRAKSVNLRASNMDQYHPAFNGQMMSTQQQPHLVDRCSGCGSTGPCGCITTHMPPNQQLQYNIDSRYDQMLKRSNSLESIQKHSVREGLVVPRSGTVRVARNRRVNESFRAAVDRSYDGSTNDSSIRQDRSDQSSQYGVRGNNNMMCSRMASSIANSTTSTANEEKYLLNGNGSNNSTNTHKKSSSLLTKFLKFGSMKKSKKKNRTEAPQTNNSKSIETKATNTKDISSRGETETARSQSSVGTHSRTHSSQSHPNLVAYNHNHHPHQSNNNMKLDSVNGHQLYSHNLKTAMQNIQHQMQANGSNGLNQQFRSSMPMCQYQPMQNNENTHHLQSHHLPMTQAKYAHNVINRPANMMTTANSQLQQNQYSHIQQPPLQHQMMARPHHQHLYGHHQQTPIDINSHPLNYSTAAAVRAQMVYNQQVGLGPNGCPPSGSNLWSPPSAAPPPASIHTTNGLWVANSPMISENHHLQHQQLHQTGGNGIYGTLPGGQPQRSMANNQIQLTQQLQNRPVPMSSANVTQSAHHTTGPQPFISPLIPGGQQQHNSNGIMHNRASMIQQGLYGTTQAHQNHHLHNQQPQHIYYYDF